MNRALGKRESKNQSTFVYSRLRIKESTSAYTFADKTDQLMGKYEEECVKLFKIHLYLMAL